MSYEIPEIAENEQYVSGDRVLTVLWRENSKVYFCVTDGPYAQARYVRIHQLYEPSFDLSLKMSLEVLPSNDEATQS